MKVISCLKMRKAEPPFLTMKGSFLSVAGLS